MGVIAAIALGAGVTVLGACLGALLAVIRPNLGLRWLR
jgi:hypothetical protein